MKKNKHVKFIELLVKQGYSVYRTWESKHANTMFGNGIVRVISLVHEDLNPICYEIWRRDLSPNSLDELKKLSLEKYADEPTEKTQRT